MVVGPCSIHDVDGALEYAGRLNELRRELAGQMEIVMRVYFEKPRTTIGWKGLINDPGLDNTHDIEAGLKKARRLLLDLTGMGLPAATEFLDPIIPQYIADLISWAAVGARTTESQTHREMASGLSMPVGFKNGTDGSLQIAIDAMGAAMRPHSFLGIDQDGITSIVRTAGNPAGHVVLRGGRLRTNYDAASIQDAENTLAQAGLPRVLMVDCSHANSGKQGARRQEDPAGQRDQSSAHYWSARADRGDGGKLFAGGQPAVSKESQGVAPGNFNHGRLPGLGGDGTDVAPWIRDIGESPAAITFKRLVRVPCPAR